MTASANPPARSAWIVLGTRNRHKAQEIIDHLAGVPIELRTLDDYPTAPEVIEDGATFLDNARKKATEFARAIGAWVLAEDSGLAVDTLGGRPGVLSARYSGPDSSDASNNRKLLDELAGLPAEKRTAYYICSAVLSDATGRVRGESEGRCHGVIGTEPRGAHGFGYDPLFVIPEYHKTFGQLGLLVKRHLSHRARALARLKPQLIQLLPEMPLTHISHQTGTSSHSVTK